MWGGGEERGRGGRERAKAFLKKQSIVFIPGGYFSPPVFRSFFNVSRQEEARSRGGPCRGASRRGPGCDGGERCLRGRERGGRDRGSGFSFLCFFGAPRRRCRRRRRRRRFFPRQQLRRRGRRERRDGDDLALHRRARPRVRRRRRHLALREARGGTSRGRKRKRQRQKPHPSLGQKSRRPLRPPPLPLGLLRRPRARLTRDRRGSRKRSRGCERPSR